MYNTVNRIVLRVTCFFFGHGELKEYWRSLGNGVSENYQGCEYCGGEK